MALVLPSLVGPGWISFLGASRMLGAQTGALSYKLAVGYRLRSIYLLYPTKRSVQRFQIARLLALLSFRPGSVPRRKRVRKQEKFKVICDKCPFHLIVMDQWCVSIK